MPSPVEPPMKTPPCSAGPDAGERRRLLAGEPQLLQGGVRRQGVAVEDAREQVIAVRFVRTALAAQGRHLLRQRNGPVAADREPLERVALVAGLTRALVLRVEEITHRPPAGFRRQRRGQRQLAVVDDGVDPALAGGELERHVRGARTGGGREQGPHPVEDRRIGAVGGLRAAPCGGDLPGGGGFLDEISRDRARSPQFQQRRPQRRIVFVAGGDLAPPVRPQRAMRPQRGIQRRRQPRRAGRRLPAAEVHGARPGGARYGRRPPPDRLTPDGRIAPMRAPPGSRSPGRTNQLRRPSVTPARSRSPEPRIENQP